MESEVRRFFLMLVLGLGGAIMLFVLRHLVAWRLRKRLPVGLVPNAQEMGRSDAMPRLVALIGQGKPAIQTLDVFRHRATLGLKLVHWAVCGAVIAIVAQMKEQSFGIGPFLVLLMLYFSVYVSVYEIRHDRETITLPRWWFGKSTHRWGDLEAVIDRPGWFLRFHFRSGQVIEAYKYVAGYAALRDKAEAVLREI